MAPKASTQVADNSSDSSNALSSDSESDRPHTPSPDAPVHRVTASRPSAALSKIPRLRATSTTSRSFSPPRTPIGTATASTPLDWGSGGDWSRLSQTTTHDMDEIRSDLDEAGGALLAEHSDDGHHDSTPDLIDFAPLPSVTAPPEPTRDVENTASELEQVSSHGELEEAIDGDHTQDISASSPTQATYEQDDTPAPTMLEAESPEIDFSHIPASSESPEQLLPPATIRGPFLNIATKEPSTDESAGPNSQTILSSAPEKADGQLLPVTIDESILSTTTEKLSADEVSRPSPQTILRGLIRDAHQEMMYFTLGHSQFSPDDLRYGLDYAYSVLQAATAKLAILRVLRDDTIEMSTLELRRWITRVDHLDDPLSSYEPRMSVIFEYASGVEMKIALAELVHSRRIVEDEVKQMREMLAQRVAAGEQIVQDASSLGDNIICQGDKADVTWFRREFFDAYETSWDAFLTVMMLITFGALYLCVRE